MTPANQEPAFKVGDVVRCVRRWRERVDYEWDGVVTKITSKRVYLGSYYWFAIDDPKRVVKPKFIDYTTTATRKTEVQP